MWVAQHEALKHNVLPLKVRARSLHSWASSMSSTKVSKSKCSQSGLSTFNWKEERGRRSMYSWTSAFSFFTFFFFL